MVDMGRETETGMQPTEGKGEKNNLFNIFYDWRPNPR